MHTFFIETIVCLFLKGENKNRKCVNRFICIKIRPIVLVITHVDLQLHSRISVLGYVLCPSSLGWYSVFYTSHWGRDITMSLINRFNRRQIDYSDNAIW